MRLLSKADETSTDKMSDEEEQSKGSVPLTHLIQILCRA